jgi:hypothetical protein
VYAQADAQGHAADEGELSETEDVRPAAKKTKLGEGKVDKGKGRA